MNDTMQETRNETVRESQIVQQSPEELTQKDLQETIAVQLTADTLYDFILFHTYSRFSGFIVNILGIAVIFMGVAFYIIGDTTFAGLSYYIVAGTAFLCFTPLRLRMNAKRMMEKDKNFREPCEYMFCDEGIRRLQGERNTLYEWDKLNKIVATPKTIGIYYNTEEALILPKYEFKDRFINVMRIISLHVTRDKVKFG